MPNLQQPSVYLGPFIGEPLYVIRGEWIIPYNLLGTNTAKVAPSLHSNYMHLSSFQKTDDSGYTTRNMSNHPHSGYSTRFAWKFPGKVADSGVDGQQGYNQNRASTGALSSYNVSAPQYAPANSTTGLNNAAYMSSYPVTHVHSIAPLPAMPRLSTSSVTVSQRPALASTQLHEGPIAMNHRNTQDPVTSVGAAAFTPPTDPVATNTPVVAKGTRASHKRARFEANIGPAVSWTPPAKKRRGSL